MPPNSAKIPQREIDLLRRWIADGADLQKGSDSPITKSISSSKSKRMQTVNDDREQTSKANDRQSYWEPVRAVARPTAFTALATHPKLRWIAVSGASQILLFDIDQRQWAKSLAFPDGEVTALRFSNDGRILLAAGGTPGLSGKVIGYELQSGLRIMELADETDVMLGMDISPDGSLVAVGGPKRVVKIFRVSDGAEVATIRNHTDWILSLAFSPDGLLLATSDRFGAIQVWEANTGKGFASLRGHTGAVHAIAWLGTSERLISAGDDGSLRLWNLHTGKEMSKVEVGIGGLLAASRLSDDSILCSGRMPALKRFGVENDKLMDLSNQPMPTETQVNRLASLNSKSSFVAADQTGRLTIVYSDEAQPLTVSMPTEPRLLEQFAEKLKLMQPEAFNFENAVTRGKLSKSGKQDVAIKAARAVDKLSVERAAELARLKMETEQAIHEAQAAIRRLEAVRESLDRLIEKQP